MEYSALRSYACGNTKPVSTFDRMDNEETRQLGEYKNAVPILIHRQIKTRNQAWEIETCKCGK